jgi:hypothetical protein
MTTPLEQRLDRLRKAAEADLAASSRDWEACRQGGLDALDKVESAG